MGDSKHFSEAGAEDWWFVGDVSTNVQCITTAMYQPNRQSHPPSISFNHLVQVIIIIIVITLITCIIMV